MQGWFRDWFASNDYIEVYNHRDDKEAEKFFTFLLEKFPIGNDKYILDAACGAGRHSIYLSQQGFKVFGFDLSRTLLTHAKRNALNKNVNVNLINGDIRTIAFQKQFDLILNLFTSFGYFEKDEENFRFFKNSFSFLKEGGYFVLDYLNKNYLIDNLVPENIEIVGDKKIIQKRRIENDRVIKDIEISNAGGKAEFFESVKLYYPEDIEKAFSNFGYTLVDRFGEYSGDTFDEKISSRYIAVFKK